jgi:hypothetical protein
MTVKEQMAPAMTGARTAALSATLGLAAAFWIVAGRQMDGMDMGVATDLGSFAFFVAAWVPMMAAMMLPGAVPAVVRCARANGRLRAAPLFAGSYLAVWTAVGLAVYALYRPHVSSAAGVLTVAAGVYELTPLKRGCRRRLPRKRWLGLRVRALLRRLDHRTDGDAGRAWRHEPHIDVRHRLPRPRAEAAVADIRHRRAAGARDHRPWTRHRRRAVVDSRSSANDLKGERAYDEPQDRNA